MMESSWREDVSKKTRILQVVMSALVGGVLVFLGIAVTLVQLGLAPIGTDTAPLVTYILLVFAGAHIVARAIVPHVVVSSGRRKIREGKWEWPGANVGQSKLPNPLESLGDAGRLFALFSTRTIVGAALLEGIAFFACITYLLEASLLSLAVALAMIAGIALHVPTKAGVVDWIERQLQLMEEERSLARP